MRGLNVDAIGSGDGNNDGGGTVATYLGEIPVFVDLKLNDLERVEVLLGPQGTLYGAGTLGGAIRYIPRKPEFGETTVSLRGEGYGYSEAANLSYDIGGTFNFGLTDTFAVRGSIDYVDDSGFIDYVNVVEEVGVTNPDTPEGLRRIEDADGEQTLSARVAARWTPTDWLDGTLTYYYQQADIEGRRVSHFRDVVPGLLDGTPSVGRYESAFRVQEPNEITADLGFAELTSATGWSTFSDEGQRDQTTLLITLEYSYELFPAFTAFTFEEGREERINQELRLVSTNEGPFNWILGGFYNKFDLEASSSEFTPNFVSGDPLEYFSTNREDLTELAVFGEVSYELWDQLTLTFGGRYYDYELEAGSSVDFPLVAFGDLLRVGVDFPLTLDEIEALDYEGLSTPDDPLFFEQSDNGFLFKVNASWQATDDLLLYATVSEGYRIGGSNGLATCPDFDPDAPNIQGSCALAPGQLFAPGGAGDVSNRDERQFLPDETRNYELGVKSTWLDGALIVNGAVYYIDWTDPQLSSATVNANIPITVNGEGARSIGLELSTQVRPTDRLEFRGSFSYIDAQLTSPVPDLVRTITPPGFGTAFEAGEDGDRLPGTPETQFSLFGAYEHPLANNASLIFNASFNWQGDVLTRAGGRGGGLALDSFGVANATLTYQADTFSVSVFADNIFDEFAETGSVGTPRESQVVLDENDDPVYARAFSRNILPPRVVGLRFTYDFSL